jgi:hypothetical protein
MLLWLMMGVAQHARPNFGEVPEFAGNIPVILDPFLNPP